MLVHPQPGHIADDGSATWRAGRYEIRGTSPGGGIEPTVVIDGAEVPADAARVIAHAMVLGLSLGPDVGLALATAIDAAAAHADPEAPQQERRSDPRIAEDLIPDRPAGDFLGSS